MPETFFITTAIDYTNGAPHIGHAYEKVLADVLTRYHRLKGDEVFFLTGVDQHGQKVQQSAEKQGVGPQEFVDGITAKFRALWEKLDVRYERWAATTDDSHKDCVRKILTRLNAAGQIYKDKRGGYYSVRQEQFLTDKERNEAGEFGPEWGEVEFREEENYYFKLAEHRQWLADLIKARTAAGTPLVIPDFRVTELLNAVEKIEGDLCISRPKARLAWGIEFPFDPDFVTYVWFDALVNYISFAPGYDPLASELSAEFRHWWPALHVIGKDILIPAHGVYWPIMLKALGFADADIPPLLVHGWWNISGAKMSKSLGNVIDPDVLVDRIHDSIRSELTKQRDKDPVKGKPGLDDAVIAEISSRCGSEALRFYLMISIASGRDADFSPESLLQNYTTSLANGIGNLLNRTLPMAANFRGSILCKNELLPLEAGSTAEEFLENVLLNYNAAFGGGVVADKDGDRVFFGGDVNIALANAFRLVTRANQFVQDQAPWDLAKKEKAGDAEAKPRLDAVLYTLAESLRIIAILISPVLPGAATGIFAQLNWFGPMTLEAATWGGLPDGHILGTPTPLFPRIETAPVA